MVMVQDEDPAVVGAVLNPVLVPLCVANAIPPLPVPAIDSDPVVISGDIIAKSTE